MDNKSIDDINKYHVKIDLFEGPLDLLWNLIFKSKLDITQISLSQITEEFIRYIRMLKIFNIEVASDFVLMASTLLHYKSKTLLPVETEIEDDFGYSLPPGLVHQLLEYKKFQQIAGKLHDLEKETENIIIRNNNQFTFDFTGGENWAEISFFDLLSAFSLLAEKLDSKTKNEFEFEIEIDDISVEECIHIIREKGKKKTSFLFSEIFLDSPSKIALMATFLAILEMVRLKEICLKQHRLFGEIRIFTIEKIATKQN